MDSPSSVKIRVMPTLRPTSPSRWAAGVGVEFDIVFSIPDCDWSGLITVHLKHKRHKRIALVFCLYRRAHEFLKTNTFLVKLSTLTCRDHTSQAVSDYLPLDPQFLFVKQQLHEPYSHR